MPRKRNQTSRNPRRRPNPGMGIMDIFLSGLSGTVGSAIGTAVETLVISAGAVAVDRLLLKRGQGQSTTTAPTAPINPSTSPAALAQFLRSNHQIAALVGTLPVLQSGTLPNGTTHEVVFSLPDGSRLAARCGADLQITLKQLPPEPAAPAQAPNPAPNYAAAPAPEPQPQHTITDLPIIECKLSPTGEYEPV